MKRNLLILSSVCFIAATVAAQDVAFFSKLKGTVKVTDVQGKEKKAAVNTKLADGDQVSTGSDGNASIMFYSGKEVALGPNKSFAVKTAKQEENSFLGGLYNTLSGMIWGSESNNTMAGATRSSTVDQQYNLTPSYPSSTKILESEPIFRWVDRRQTSAKDYLVIIESEVSSFHYEIAASNTNEIAYPKTAPKLKNETEEKYFWTVKDSKGADVSPKASFTLISPDNRSKLEEGLKEILRICNGDNTNPQWYLLTSALYKDLSLMKQSENSVLALLALKPDMAQAHYILATLYRETGRFDEAKSEDEKVKKLNEGK